MMVIGLSFVVGYVRFKTGSLWPCVLLHAGHNVFLQTIFDPLTVPLEKTSYFTGEFGAGLALTVAAVGFYLWQHASHLYPSASTSPEFRACIRPIPRQT
jgi:membrane protease YdiL (CAAX protease family)